MAKSLGLPERAALILLAVEGGRAVSSELKKMHGLDLKKTQRDNLAGRGMIAVAKAGRSTALILTDSGWAFLDDGFTSEPLPRGSSPGAGGRALFALLPRFAARGQTLRSLLAETAKPPERQSQAAAGTLDARIADTYRTLAEGARDWVSLTALRKALGDVSRDDLDAELHRMHRAGAITMTLEEDQGRLSKEDRAAALRIGPDQMHYLSMD